MYFRLEDVMKSYSKDTVFFSSFFSALLQLGSRFSSTFKNVPLIYLQKTCCQNEGIDIAARKVVIS